MPRVKNTPPAVHDHVKNNALLRKTLQRMVFQRTSLLHRLKTLETFAHDNKMCKCYLLEAPFDCLLKHTE